MQASEQQSGPPPKSTTPSWADKSRLESMRKATPDSEALSSDDDDHELPRMTPTTSNPQQPPSSHPPHSLSQRRTSWLSEIQSGFPPRRPSLASASNTSQPATPSSEPNPWPVGIPLGRVSSNPPATSNAWSSNTGVWGSADQHRGSISRFLDTSTNQPHPAQAAPFAPADQRQPAGDFPFNIPLHPTPKTYRSQSYSVGQAEAESNQNVSKGSHTAGQGPPSGRQRLGSQQSLWHRPSRPSMLSEVHQGNSMSALHEESDDFETSHTSDVQSTRGADRVALAAGSVADEDQEQTPTAATAGYSASHARDDDESSEPDLAGNLTRRFSELAGLAGLGGHIQNAGSAGAVSASRKSPWQTSLGFGELSEPFQSRRHSMAQVPSHRAANLAASSANRFSRPSFSSDNLPPLETCFRKQSFRNDQRINSIDEFGISPTSAGQYDQTSAPAAAQYSAMPYGMNAAHQQMHAQGMFSRPGQDTRLYLVTFKNSRADVYFVAPNTGLQINVGDDVIVEADRGHDLGTVQYAGLDWAQARELKQQASDEHYRRLMSQSRNPKHAGDAGQSGDNSAGGFGAPARGGPDLALSPGDSTHAADLKPKMIKRMAQPHETATRRDKESNEAKARKICQQKVIEHGLDMEILDAEFQMDWKKLTFCYYAHSYVNFNILVTELFKVYKTRIWMSAVNPASLSSPVGVARGAAFDSGLMHRGSPMEGSSQDLDPTGAVPPNMNPSTNAFYEYAYATRQTAPNPMQSAFRQPMGGSMYSPVPQVEYAMQPGMSYWPDAPGSYLGSALPKTQAQYNAAAASHSPAFSQRPTSRDHHSASPYQSFGGGGPIGNPIARPVGEPST